MTTDRRSVRACGGVMLPMAALGLLVAACAGNPPRPTLANARLAVERSAERDGYEYAPLEMRLARERLAKAEKAMEDEDYEDARRLAEKALVDAKLAEAKAEAGRAQARTTDLRKSVEGFSDTGDGQGGTQGGGMP